LEGSHEKFDHRVRESRYNFPPHLSIEIRVLQLSHFMVDVGLYLVFTDLCEVLLSALDGVPNPIGLQGKLQSFLEGFFKKKIRFQRKILADSFRIRMEFPCDEAGTVSRSLACSLPRT